jgi:hypothetical protein
MKKVIALGFFLIIVVSVWCTIAPAHIELYSGETLKAPMLWVNDSLLYVWRGPDQISPADTQFCDAIRLSDIARIVLRKGTSFGTCYRRTFFVLGGAQVVGFLASGESEALGGLFVGTVLVSAIGAVVIAPAYWLIENIARVMEEPAVMPASYIHQKYGRFLYLDAILDADRIEYLETRCKP